MNGIGAEDCLTIRLLAYGWLAKAKGLRGTPFDLFGYTAERRGERAAIVEFETAMRRVVQDLTAQRLADSLELRVCRRACAASGTSRSATPKRRGSACSS